MDVQDFTQNYLQPSEAGLDRRFTMPLPDIAGLAKTGRFIVQGEQDDTFSTNIMETFASETSDVRLVEVYKNTQERVQGTFIRLVGTISVVKKGWPFFFLDAAVSNVSPITARKEDLTTRVAVHLPQADPDSRNSFFDSLSQQAGEAGYDCATRQIEQLPEFWGPLWSGHTGGVSLDFITTLRGFAWKAYEQYCSTAPRQADFDYTPTKQHIVFKHSWTEHHLFKKMGLSVPVESQAAFFSVLVAGV